MSDTELHDLGPAAGAEIEKDGDNWTLVLVRELRHTPELVWQAITDPVHLIHWAPFDADGNLGTAGATIHLTTVKAPQPHVTETTIAKADAPNLLEYTWGGGMIRWQLEPTSVGTRLTLWHQIDKRYIAMGAAGWHVCFDVLARHLDGADVGRIVSVDAMQHAGWQRLFREYSEQFGMEMPKW